MSTKYTVRVTRSNQWWLAEVPELDRVYTQAKTLNQVESLVREVIHLVHDIDPESFELEVTVAAADLIGDQFERFLDARTALLKAIERESEAKREVARMLVKEQGLTQADAGHIMGLTAQRVSQLLIEA